MMKSIILFFTLSFILLPFSFLQAQETWIKTYSPFYIDDGWYNVEDVIVCQDNGYAINGTYVEYDAEMGIEWAHWGFLMKTDSDGNFLWAKADTVDFMGWNESYAFVETENGDFICIGYSYGGGYMIKRDSEGNRIWAIPYNDFGANSMCKTSDGNIILGGVVASEIALRKIDSNGNTIWTNSHNCGYTTIAKSIIQTSDGGFALTGYTSGNGYDIIIMKTDSIGDSLWTITFDGYGDYDEGWSIIENYEDKIFVSGYFEGNNRTYYGVLIKLDSDGELIFLLNEENSEDYYLFRSMVESITDSEIVGYGRVENDIALLSYNYEGENLWYSLLPIRTALGDKCLQKINNGFILCARSMNWDIALVKTDSNGQVTSIDAEILPVYDYMLTNCPNPFNPQTTIKFNIPYPSNVLLQIYNVKGQLVKTLLNEEKQSGEHTIIWNAKDQSSGVYFVKVSNNAGLLKNYKIILLK